MFRCAAFRAELPPQLAVALVTSCSSQPAAMTTIQGQMSGQLPASVSPYNCFVRNLTADAFFTLNSEKQQCPKNKMLRHSLSFPEPTHLVPVTLYL